MNNVDSLLLVRVFQSEGFAREWPVLCKTCRALRDMVDTKTFYSAEIRTQVEILDYESTMRSQYRIRRVFFFTPPAHSIRIPEGALPVLVHNVPDFKEPERHLNFELYICIRKGSRAQLERKREFSISWGNPATDAFCRHIEQYFVRPSLPEQSRGESRVYFSLSEHIATFPQLELLSSHDNENIRHISHIRLHKNFFF